MWAGPRSRAELLAAAASLERWACYAVEDATGDFAGLTDIVANAAVPERLQAGQPGSNQCTMPDAETAAPLLQPGTRRTYQTVMVAVTIIVRATIVALEESVVGKPGQLFDRETEWAEVTEFATSDELGATLGLVYGRRRQGKTLLLELLALELGGFMFAATQQSEAQSLADLGAAYAAYRGLRQPVVFTGYREAIDEMLLLGADRPTAVIIDEFPYLVAATPALPSYLQQALSPMGNARQRTRTRMVLCGSALTTMAQLLGGGAPLRGRARLELVVRPFGFREAAEFWDVAHDPELAFRLHALTGGTPAYKDMCGGAGPRSLADFGTWVQRRLLNPASAMFREGGLLLREEPSITDPTSYSATLGAISAGACRRSEIAAALGRPASAIAHLLDGLEDVGLIEQLDDALRGKRAVFRIAEPIVRLQQLITARYEPELVAGRANRVWERSAATVSAKILGPHFEELARQWCMHYADEQTLGAVPGAVRPTEIACRDHHGGHELDLVVTDAPSGKSLILAIGEAKETNAAVGQAQLRRLEHLRGLLPSARVDLPPKLLLFSRSGFTPGLIEEAGTRPDVELVTLERVYRGS